MCSDDPGGMLSQFELTTAENNEFLTGGLPEFPSPAEIDSARIFWSDLTVGIAEQFDLGNILQPGLNLEQLTSFLIDRYRMVTTTTTSRLLPCRSSVAPRRWPPSRPPSQA